MLQLSPANTCKHIKHTYDFFTEVKCRFDFPHSTYVGSSLKCESVTPEKFFSIAPCPEKKFSKKVGAFERQYRRECWPYNWAAAAANRKSCVALKLKLPQKKSQNIDFFINFQKVNNKKFCHKIFKNFRKS